MNNCSNVTKEILDKAHNNMHQFKHQRHTWTMIFYNRILNHYEPLSFHMW